MSILAVALLLGAGPTCDTAVTQLELTECASRQFEKADRALNAQWKMTLAEMRKRDADPAEQDSTGRPGFADALLTSQRTWLAYRDAQCQLERLQAHGGSMASMLEIMCKASLTDQRTAALLEAIEEN
jgi:uncharacterized protein YecT (DUF1311 family)